MLLNVLTGCIAVLSYSSFPPTPSFPTNSYNGSGDAFCSVTKSKTLKACEGDGLDTCRSGLPMFLVGLKASCQVVCQEHFPIQSVLICLALYKLYPCRSAEVQVFLVARLTAECCSDVLETGNFGGGRGGIFALFMESAVDLQALIYFKGFKTLGYWKRPLFCKWKLVLLHRSCSIVQLHRTE